MVKCASGNVGDFGDFGKEVSPSINPKALLRRFGVHCAIRGIGRVLMTPHSKRFSDRNTNLFMNRSFILHQNWIFYISKSLFSELLEWSCQDLIPINTGINHHFIPQVKKCSGSYLSPSEYLSKYHSGFSSPFFVINTIRVEFLIHLSSYPILYNPFHANFDTHFISPDISFPLLHSQMHMSFGKL